MILMVMTVTPERKGHDAGDRIGTFFLCCLCTVVYCCDCFPKCVFFLPKPTNPVCARQPVVPIWFPCSWNSRTIRSFPLGWVFFCFVLCVVPNLSVASIFVRWGFPGVVDRRRESVRPTKQMRYEKRSVALLQTAFKRWLGFFFWRKCKKQRLIVRWLSVWRYSPSFPSHAISQQAGRAHYMRNIQCRVSNVPVRRESWTDWISKAKRTHGMTPKRKDIGNPFDDVLNHPLNCAV